MPDQLGFIEERCPYCDAHMYQPEPTRKPICLNACLLPTWQSRLMQQGLREAAARVDAEMREETQREGGASSPA